MDQSKNSNKKLLPKTTSLANMSGWMRQAGVTRIFYETSGNGPQQIVFCHTAGSDSRQYHGILNHPEMMEKCTMYAFDLPSHGRFFPGSNYIPGNHSNDEDKYVGTIASFIKTLKLDKPIVCGASMAGQVCIAVAIRNDELQSGGTIPFKAATTSLWTVNSTINHQSSIKLSSTPTGSTA